MAASAISMSFITKLLGATVAACALAGAYEFYPRPPFRIVSSEALHVQKGTTHPKTVISETAARSQMEDLARNSDIEECWLSATNNKTGSTYFLDVCVEQTPSKCVTDKYFFRDALQNLNKIAEKEHTTVSLRSWHIHPRKTVDDILFDTAKQAVQRPGNLTLAHYVRTSMPSNADYHTDLAMRELVKDKKFSNLTFKLSGVVTPYGTFFTSFEPSFYNKYQQLGRTWGEEQFNKAEKQSDACGNDLSCVWRSFANVGVLITYEKPMKEFLIKDQ